MTGVPVRLLAGAVLTALLAGCGAATPTRTAVLAPPSHERVAVAPATPSGSTLTEATRLPATAAHLAASPGLQIRSVSNFRDVAGSGEGLLLKDGTRMARGVVYRSGKLKPISAADKRRLVAAGLTDIYDLRTPTVAKKSPDPKVPGATRHAVNIFAVKATPAVKPSSVAKAKAHMKSVNRKFVSSAKQRKAIATVLKGIAGDEGPVLIHCTEGKDRTGWISAMLQLIAGASEKAVIGEYLLSNTYRKALIDKEVAKARRSGGKKAADIKKALLKVDDSYLKAGLSEMKKRYGSLDGYLKKGLGLKQATIDDLRETLRAG